MAVPQGKYHSARRVAKQVHNFSRRFPGLVGPHTVWQRKNIPDVPELFAKALKNARRDSASLAGFVIPFRLDGSSPIPGSNVRRKSSSREDILNR